MKNLRSFLCLLALLPFFAGCLLMSTHSTRQMQVRVTERESGKPVPNVTVEIHYSYDSYGMVYVMRVPKPASAKTDDQGVALLPIADFEQSILLKVNGQPFRLNKKLVTRGGYAEGGEPDGRGPYVVQLSRANGGRQTAPPR